MNLTRLKYWRELRGYTVRELAAKVKKENKSGPVSMSPATITLLENSKRPPHVSTVRALAAALGVEVADLYGPESAPVLSQPINNTETITEIIKPSRSRVAKKQQPPAGNCWVIDHEGDAFGPFVTVEAERLKAKLGGQHQARVYEAESKAEVNKQHTQFLIRVAMGHDAW